MPDTTLLTAALDMIEKSYGGPAPTDIIAKSHTQAGRDLRKTAADYLNDLAFQFGKARNLPESQHLQKFLRTPLGEALGMVAGRGYSTWPAAMVAKSHAIYMESDGRLSVQDCERRAANLLNIEAGEIRYEV